MSISIDPQEMYVWLAYEDGYRKAVGNVVKIDGILFSIVPLKKENGGVEIVFSDLRSGGRFLALPIHTVEAALCSTKEQALAMFKDKSWVVKDLIKQIGRKKVIKAINEQTTFMQRRYGKMPAIELYRGSFEEEAE